jgi:hypothetical protein
MLVMSHYQQGKGHGNKIKGKPGKWHYVDKSTN